MTGAGVVKKCKKEQVRPTPSGSGIGPDLLENEESKDVTFQQLGLCEELILACKEAGWSMPTRIQAATVPVVREGRDVIGVAQTGSGKTGAYVLPLVDWLLTQSKVPYLSVLVMVPTRELAQQVTAQFVMLGRSVGLRVVTLVGGVDMVDQACDLSKRPHVVVGTPGRVKDHLNNTKGFQMVKLHALVLDEADKMLEMDYEKEIDAILEHLPHSRQTLLFSATLNTKIDRLQKASLNDPVLLQVHRKNTTVDTLKQFYIFTPFVQMLPTLHLYLTRETGNHILVFCRGAALVHRITLTLRILGHRALPLMGCMTQRNRNVALTKFKEGKARILVCTDVAQRGLDIPHTDVVVNFALPDRVEDYIHRVGRTARAGAQGKAVNIISQYDIVSLQKVEASTGVKCEEWPIQDGDVAAVLQRVEDAEQEAVREMRENQQESMLKMEARQITTAKLGKRERGDNDMGYDDAKHGAADFSTLRMRRQNEEVFQMTKKQQYKRLQSMRREARKKSKS
ncbi:DEAD DEAH box helicase Helicase conserved C terminal domain [Trypanosoma vivax]|uniref:Probable eukaryotic initiation factor 4A n=1 Tax=Trypanosoma vivax (strain Y486) TaxID=1055687 RepID=G0U6S2_TRYVY|nr:DEAD DEAH box helicase Helicase conserved C terminal domain [Trypanosoma vivax]CCC51576.1 putative DEAD box RNA helicase [Trypanosoma vivax Y486]